MELTKKERLGFIYQLRILEALYPDDAEYYSRHRIALERGYALNYTWMFEQVEDEMSVDECKEVLEILDMYRAITFAVKKLGENDELKSHYLAKFSGFDGNNESEQMSYAQYFLVDLDRYTELKEGNYTYLNSHAPMLGTYRRMLQIWRSIANKFELSREQLSSILGTA